MQSPVQLREAKSSPVDLRLATQRLKRYLRDFNRDEDGLNSVEVIILLFVAAVILIGFFTLIWPNIKDAVIRKLTELFNTTAG